jgi:hypothetical protein
MKCRFKERTAEMIDLQAKSSTSLIRRVCHGSMPAPETVSIENLSHWSHAFFASRFTGSNLGTQQCTHPGGFLGLWRSQAGKMTFPVEYLIRKGTVHELLCRKG